MENWNTIAFRANTRQKHLDKHERICRELKWLAKGESYIAPNVKHYIIMKGGATVVGYYSIAEHEHGRQASICAFYIAPTFRGQGLGKTALLKILYGLYKMNKYATIFCRVAIDNQIALPLYKKYSWFLGKDGRLHNESDSAAIDPTTNEYTMVFMEKVWGDTSYTMKEALKDVFNRE